LGVYLRKSRQKNAQTASQTHDIARETLDIASVVLSNTQNKVFE
jgi:hypothetical protein